ncbi:hypothetical protein Pan258_01500 [Symmachiella dynata]|nr:hypothetical protein Pan258_01500 [Symmachiella dynata]
MAKVIFDVTTHFTFPDIATASIIERSICSLDHFNVVEARKNWNRQQFLDDLPAPLTHHNPALGHLKRDDRVVAGAAAMFGHV